MRIHLIGVAGSGMGSLAGLLKSVGHEISGSDRAFNPPMGDALKRWGIQTLQGYKAEHLSSKPDLVVIGNVCRKDNPEAKAAIDAGMAVVSMPEAIEKMFLSSRPSYVVAARTARLPQTTCLLFYSIEAASNLAF